MQVTYIKTVNISNDDKISDFVTECLSFMSEEEFDQIVFDELNADVEVVFAFLPDHLITRLIQTLKKYEIYISHQDITDAVLMGYVNSNKHFSTVFSGSNIDSYVLPLLETYLLNNLTKDIILDKILEQGIENLTSLDKQILKK